MNIMFNDRLEVHNNTMVKIQHTWHTSWAPAKGEGRGGGVARIGVHPPLIENKTIFFCYMGGLLATFSQWRGGLFWYVFPLMVGPFHHVKAFLLPFLHVEAFLLRFSTYWGLLNSLYEGFSAPFFSMGGGGGGGWLFWSHGGPFMGGRPCTLHIYYNTAKLKCIKILIYKITVIIQHIDVYMNQYKKQSNVFALRCFCVASFWQRNAQTLRCSLDCCTICH